MDDKIQADLLRCGDISDFLSFWLANSSILKNEETLRHYYKNFLRNFGPRMQKFYRTQSREVVDMILQRKTPSVLDVGCGCGTESLWFAKLGASVWGIDLISSHIAVAEERKAIMEELLNRKLSCKFSLDSVFDLGKSGEQFDIIWMEQTFHHIEPREDVTRILGSLLKDDGTVIISESNAWNPLIQMGVFKLRGTKTVIDLEIDGKTYKWGHERILTPRSLVKTLRLGGFSADAHSYFRLLPSNKIFDKISWIESIWPRFLFPAFTHYNITARKTARASN